MDGMLTAKGLRRKAMNNNGLQVSHVAFSML